MKAIKVEKILEKLSELRKSIREVRICKQLEAIWLKKSLGWSRKEKEQLVNALQIMMKFPEMIKSKASFSWLKILFMNAKLY